MVYASIHIHCESLIGDENDMVTVWEVLFQTYTSIMQSSLNYSCTDYCAYEGEMIVRSKNTSQSQDASTLHSMMAFALYKKSQTQCS